MDIKTVVNNLSGKIKTPFYLYDTCTLETTVCSLNTCFYENHFKILYAMKANSNPHILKIIRAGGMGVDACSVEEVRIAFLCGFNPEDIYYNSDCLTSDEIDFAVIHNLNLVIGSLDSLKYLTKNYHGHDVSLRLNSGVGAGHSSKVITNGEFSKFGILLSDIEDAISLCKKSSVRISGIHSHTGSGEMATESYIENAKVLIELSGKFESLQFINFGGGFGYDYKEHAAYDITTLHDALNKLRHEHNISSHLRLIIEPGRYIVADSGFLISKVCSVKQSASRNFIGLDTGYNHFPRCFYYDAWHDIENLSTQHTDTAAYDITGYLCQSGDIFARQRLMPKTQVGDLICIKDVGAYGYSMSSNFNSRVRPGEYLLKDNGEVKMIRRPETFEDIISTFTLD